MKNLIYIICIICYTFCNAQNQRFIYHYTFIPDTISKVKNSELVRLDVFKDKSTFYGEKKFTADSIKLENIKKGINDMTPPSEKVYTDIIIKNKINNKITYSTYLANDKLMVTEDNQFNWNLTPDFSYILGYKAQQAETYFRGRKWIAWFTSELPISDGPFKFKGLPGLILKIYDTTNSHLFEIVQVQNVKPYDYPEVKDYTNKIVVNYEVYKSLFKKNRNNPIAHLIGKIPDYYDFDGNFVSGSSILKEIEKIEKDDIKKNNNLIEIDLIQPTK